MSPADVRAAAVVAGDALATAIPVAFLPSSPEEERVHLTRRVARVAHLLETDPDGAWVAEDEDGEVVGVALAIVREGVWGLSLLGVKPDLQSRGVGRQLLRESLRTLDGCRGGIVLASTDARAMRSYFRAGFKLVPCVAAAGEVNRARIPSGLKARPGALEDERDRALIDAASRRARGATHAPDVETLRAAGSELLVHDGGGWAMHRDGSPVVLAAHDDAVAADLLWSCFAGGAAGGAVHVDFIAHDNDWAIAVALDMGLSLGTEGPVFVRGELGTMAPYLPSGAYL
ncbi:MAG TPA: GNAT family N-acetyltransferase [Baekduia sp.]|uniref:GNAT family N-acetyltransferase n=1 Tax=Baekduia sp. TaxID=2600305 RepID=UPI002D77136C|nr:GNAT family N-acetyltransferase [Baekduia sp.]HET6508542.1 GNAT family N-acetyltransferase [Baekduia sp.]